jgi:hypothetical protein
MRDFSSDPGIPAATVVVKRAHDIMLDYIKEATQGLLKMLRLSSRKAMPEPTVSQHLKAIIRKRRTSTW